MTNVRAHDAADRVAAYLAAHDERHADPEGAGGASTRTEVARLITLGGTYPLTIGDLRALVVAAGQRDRAVDIATRAVDAIEDIATETDSGDNPYYYFTSDYDNDQERKQLATLVREIEETSLMDPDQSPEQLLATLRSPEHQAMTYLANAIHVSRCGEQPDHGPYAHEDEAQWYASVLAEVGLLADRAPTGVSR